MKNLSLPSVRFRGLRVGLAGLILFALFELPTRSAEPPPVRSSRFSFSLLPKSFQRRPSLDFHVITELTPEGRKLAAPTATAPVYYIAQPGQFTQMGNNTPGGETPPDLQQLSRAMEAALASGHYSKATPSTPLPAIAIVFTYGSFARFAMDAYDQQDDQMLAQLGQQTDDANFYSGPLARSEERSIDALLPVVLTHQRARDDVLRRATLVGGEKFSDDLARALAEEARSRVGRNSVLGFPGVDAAGPFHRFMNANENLVMLVEDSFSGCYFVIASAFDYRAMRKGQRVLLWRTKMTVNASGVSMSESLPALVQTAGPFLGTEMAEAVTLSRKIRRDGKVTIGEAQVVGTDVPLAGGPVRTEVPGAAPSAPAASPGDKPAKP